MTNFFFQCMHEHVHVKQTENYPTLFMFGTAVALEDNYVLFKLHVWAHMLLQSITLGFFSQQEETVH